MANCYTDAYDLPDDSEVFVETDLGVSKGRTIFAESAFSTAVYPESDKDSQAYQSGVGLKLRVASSPRLLYIYSLQLQQLSLELPVNRERSKLVLSLATALGLLDEADLSESPPASIEQLREYHSLAYLAAITHYHKLKPLQLLAYGLTDDCAPFPGLYEFGALVAGGSLQAATALCSGRYHRAVHFDGGRHHAHKSRADGFCYINDVVLAVLQLLGSFQRVLYLDLDIHHCDAVQEAFNLTSRVLTVSIHKHAPGFYPGTGSMRSIGSGQGRGFSLNLPLEDGLRDARFVQAFSLLGGGAVELYRPSCVVLQCGVDGLAHDPLAGSWGLTSRGYADCARIAAGWGLPLLVLGGGGYSDTAAACAWVAVLAAVQGKDLPDDVPDHDFFDRYGPHYQLNAEARPLLVPDQNSPELVQGRCQQLLRTLCQAMARSAQGDAAGQREEEGGSAAKRGRVAS